MANNLYILYKTLRDCREKAWIKPVEKAHAPTSLSSEWPIAFVTMDILRLLLNKLNSNWIILVMMDRYSKLARTVPGSKTAANHVPSMFMNNEILSYGITNSCCRTTEHSLSVNFPPRWAPSQIRNIWQLRRTTWKRTERRNDLIKQLSRDRSTALQSFSQTGTFIYSH